MQEIEVNKYKIGVINSIASACRTTRIVVILATVWTARTIPNPLRLNKSSRPKDATVFIQNAKKNTVIALRLVLAVPLFVIAKIVSISNKKLKTERIIFYLTFVFTILKLLLSSFFIFI